MIDLCQFNGSVQTDTRDSVPIINRLSPKKGCTHTFAASPSWIGGVSTIFLIPVIFLNQMIRKEVNECTLQERAQMIGTQSVISGSGVSLTSSGGADPFGRTGLSGVREGMNLKKMLPYFLYSTLVLYRPHGGSGLTVHYIECYLVHRQVCYQG